MKKMTAPWTQGQVDALNRYQKLGFFHPYTCPNHHKDRLLVATDKGWVCPECDYTQDWAHQVATLTVGSNEQ